MADPLSAAGLVVATLTLPAQIFSNCVLAYTTISDINATGRRAGTLFWLFRVQHTRFLVWGQNSDVYRDGINPAKLSQPVFEIIVSTLMQIKDLLQDVDTLQRKYGLHQIPKPNSAEPRPSQREITRQSTLVFQVQKSCSLFRRLRWAVHDAERFSCLIQELTQFNDALYQFSPLVQRTSQTVSVDAEALAMAIVNEGWQGVQALQQAVGPGQVTGAQHAPSGANSQLPSRTAAYLNGTHFMAAEIGPNQPLDQFRPAMNLIVNYGLFQFLALQNDTPHRRSWAQYNTFNVVVEWRSYNPRQMSAPGKNALQKRVEMLVSMLQQGPKPPGFRILDCLGYVEDNSKARFGIVLRYPQPYTLYQGPYTPMTLYQIIRQQKPPFLGDRFQLASFLAESLYELHASRWLHKSINSHNILFFHQSPNRSPSGPSAGITASLSHPFFAGFNLSRPEDAASDPHNKDLDTAMYKHPDIQGLGGAPTSPYHYLYDMYSLGTVLLEIGTWYVLESFYKQNQIGSAFRQRLLHSKVPLLGISMGENYMIAVRKCLEGQFDGMQQFHDQERDSQDYIVNLHRSFYWEVVKLLKECHV